VDLDEIRLAGPVAVLVALSAGVLSFPLFTWLSGAGLVTGSPWLLAVLIPVIVLAGTRPVQTWIGGGRLDNRPVLRLGLAFSVFAAESWVAGWSLVLPATVILVAVVHIQRSGAWVWRPAVVALAITTTVGQAGVAAGLVASVAEPAVSHMAAATIAVLSGFGILSVGLTVAERDAAQDALARTEARLRALMESATDVLTVTDDDGRLSYVSPAVEHTFGVSPEDLVGSRLIDLVEQDHRARVEAHLAEVVDGGPAAIASLDVLVVPPDGERRWFEWTVRNLLADPFVAGLVIEQRDVTERLRHQEALAHAAAHDDLTELPNRSGLMTRLAQAVAGAGPDAGTAVLFLDLDRFKEVNDNHGHGAGDAVLVVLAQRLRAALRPQDHLARISGDEFCAILTDIGEAGEVTGVVDRLAAVCEAPVALDDGTLVDVGVSIGVALAFDPTRDPETLFTEADAAMYRVKHLRRPGRAHRRATDDRLDPTSDGITPA
jgi:diguanylate cyclase (GGDEF)-like protein/PAS domain S-box-containing protein